MARDYKNSGRAPAKKGKSGPSGMLMLMIGLFAGLIIGVVAGLGVVATRTYVELRQALAQEMAANAGLGSRTGSSGKGASAESRPRFEFYKILPEMEVVVPEEEARKLESPAASTPATAATPTPAERYLLQVASFQRHEDADRLKAQLALLGVEANIQTVEIKGGQTWHRVRVGPFSNNRELSSVRERLQANGIQAVLLKLNG